MRSLTIITNAVSFILFHAIRNPTFLYRYLRGYLLGTEYAANAKIIDDHTLATELLPHKSFIRIGDGEIGLLNGKGIHYQQYSPELADELRNIITQYTSNAPYVLAIPPFVNYTHKQLVAQQGNLACWLPFQITYATHFNHDRAYGNALFFYYRLYFNSFFFETLANAKLIIVTNQEAIEQIHTSPHGAQLLFVETPAAQAYESLSTIMNDLHALRVQHPEAIPILSCGPAGKIIVYRLACEGIISYDVGFGLRYLYDQNDHATGLPTITAANRS